MDWRPDVPLTRRTALKLTAAAGTAAGMLGLSGVTASTERYGVSFTKTVNLVDDYGADPTGNEPINDALKNAADDDTLIVIPDGEYLFDGEFRHTQSGNIGIVAADGANPRFIAPQGHSTWLLNLYHMPAAIVEGIDIDQTAPKTATGIRFDIKHTIHAEDIKYHGRGVHDGENGGMQAIHVELWDSDGTAMVKNVVDTKGNKLQDYKNPNSRMAVWAGHNMHGTLTIKDCHFEEFGNNCVYASKTPGDVQIEGGVFRNNNISQLRIGGKGSYIDDALVEVDLSKYKLEPPERSTNGYNTRGIVIEADETVGAPGAEVRNTEVRLTDVDATQGAIYLIDWAGGGDIAPVIKNSTIVTRGNVRGIASLAEQQDASVTAKNIVLLGEDNSHPAVFLNQNADGSVIENSCIECTGDGDGVLVDGDANVTVRDSNVNVGGTPFVECNGADIKQSNNTLTRSCSPNTGSPTVEALAPQKTSLTTATLAADLTLGGADRGNAFFQWRRADETEWNRTNEQSVKNNTRVEAGVVGLNAGSPYKYRVVLDAGDETVRSSIKTFQTDANENGPSITQYNVDEADVVNDHATVNIDWAVEDDDGNLDTMLLTLADAETGTVFTSRGHDVNGTTASGSTTLIARNVPERKLDVTATAIDTQNKATSKSKTVQE